MNRKELNEILKSHKMWLNNSVNGKKADLSNANLYKANLTDVNLSHANLLKTNLSYANLIDTNLSGANLSNANLYKTDLLRTNLYIPNLYEANLTDANLYKANLYKANLSGANLYKADLSYTNLTDANLSRANLTDANLSRANLTDANLSGCKGLLNPKDWMNNNFKKTEKGYIVYKAIGETYYKTPKYWEIKEDSYIEEICNQNRTNPDGCGINFATKDRVQNEFKNKKYDLWECLLEWEDLINVCVPYNTDGVIRCRRLKLLKIINKENEIVMEDKERKCYNK